MERIVKFFVLSFNIYCVLLGQEIAEYKKLEELGAKSVRVWVVKPDVLKKHNVTPPVPNEWKYFHEQPKLPAPQVS